MKAARLCPKVLGQDTKRWEDWIFTFTQKNQLQVIIPYIPTESPRLSHLVYEMVLAHFLVSDRQVSHSRLDSRHIANFFSEDITEDDQGVA